MLAATLDDLAGVEPERPSTQWWCGYRRVRRDRGLTSSNHSQAQIQGFEMAHPNVYHIYKLLEHMQGASPTVPKLPDLHDTGEQKDM